MVVKQIDSGVFTSSDVFDSEECQALIDRAEAIGFAEAMVRTKAGPRMMKSVRNNDRVDVKDPALADLMWDRIAPVLPVLDGQQPLAVDHRLRFYRYLPGHEFKRHKDGVVSNGDGQLSKLTYLVYLNGGFEGGATVFRDYFDAGDSREKIEHVVKPEVGLALLFRHERWHEGRAVMSSRKYVLRSDGFYG